MKKLIVFLVILVFMSACGKDKNPFRPSLDDCDQTTVTVEDGDVVRVDCHDHHHHHHRDGKEPRDQKKPIKE